MGMLKKKFRNIKKLPTWIFFFPALLLKISRAFLLKVKFDDPNNYVNEARGFVTVTWHNRLLYFPAVFPKTTRQHTVAVVSPSRDGQYIVDLISHFQLKSLRGSSSKKGAKAQRAAFNAIAEGYNVSFTPDGPRGPKYKMSKGPIHLASKTGHPIMPISINASRYWELKSWDNFQIAKPFSQITLAIGDLIYIPPDLNEQELEEWRVKVEEKLMAITVDKTDK